MYAKLNNGQLQKYPYTMGMLRKDNHNVSFPKVMTDEIFAQFGVVRVTPTPRPEYDHTKEFNVVAEQVNGAWVEKWVATDVSAEEIAQRTENQANNVRAERNQKLSQSDWTQVPMKVPGTPLQTRPLLSLAWVQKVSITSFLYQAAQT
jgi:hypothetical protein